MNAIQRSTKKGDSYNDGMRRAAAVQSDAKLEPKMSRVDEPMLVLVLLLVAVGLICLFSASYTNAYYLYGGDSTHYVLRQAMFAGMGVVVMLLASNFNYHKLHYFAVPLMVFSVILLSTIIYLPSIWYTSHDATRWIDLKFTTFQPSEITKFAVILLFSSLATIWGPKKMKTFRYGLMPLLIVLIVVAGLLYLEPHLSATIIIAAIGIITVFLGGCSMKWVIGGGLAVVGGGVLLVTQLGYAQTRIQVWLDPFKYMYGEGKGWQGAQSLIAIGSGGFWGLGLGQSRQKHVFLPETPNDFIFPIVCEELGFVGATLIIILFAALILRGYYIAMRAEDKFGTLLAAGITTQIAIQVVLNLCVVTGLVPVTGVSLPFFSYGGTSLLMLLGEVGILLGVSRTMPAPKSG